VARQRDATARPCERSSDLEPSQHFPQPSDERRQCRLVRSLRPQAASRLATDDSGETRDTGSPPRMRTAASASATTVRRPGQGTVIVKKLSFNDRHAGHRRRQRGKAARASGVVDSARQPEAASPRRVRWTVKAERTHRPALRRRLFREVAFSPMCCSRAERSARSALSVRHRRFRDQAARHLAH